MLTFAVDSVGARFLQAFGLGGVIATFGLVLDLVGFVLLLVFVLISSIVSLRRERSVGATFKSGRDPGLTECAPASRWHLGKGLRCPTVSGGAGRG